MLSLLYGLIAAITWGGADFAGGLASRKTSSFQVVTLSWFIGLAVMPVVTFISGEPNMPLSSWLLCGIAGAFGVTGILILYKLMADGNMSIAVSLSAVMAGALPVLVSAVVEGLPRPIKLIGFILAFIAVWLVTKEGNGNSQLRQKEVALALLAGLGFGMYFILVNQASQEYTFWPMVATRLVGAVILVVCMRSRKQSWLPPKNVTPLIVINFVLDTAGTFAFILAGQVGRLDLASVLGSLYPGITILLAWWLLHEELKAVQWVGIGLALCSIALLAV